MAATCWFVSCPSSHINLMLLGSIPRGPHSEAVDQRFHIGTCKWGRASGSFPGDAARSGKLMHHQDALHHSVYRAHQASQVRKQRNRNGAVR